jgi:hypothetical protein
MIHLKPLQPKEFIRVSLPLRQMKIFLTQKKEKYLRAKDMPVLAKELKDMRV